MNEFISNKYTYPSPRNALSVRSFFCSFVRPLFYNHVSHLAFKAGSLMKVHWFGGVVVFGFVVVVPSIAFSHLALISGSSMKLHWFSGVVVLFVVVVVLFVVVVGHGFCTC